MSLTYKEVIEANIELHRREAKIYDRIHQEIWNSREQKRSWKILRFAVSQVEGNRFRALDFGSGTGNVTGKLLDLGFEVTAIDLSPEMNKILKLKYSKDVVTRKLQILNLNIDKVQMEGDFDFVACFSVLHHLPDYIGTLRKLARLIRKGGVFYLDFEPAPLFPERNPRFILNRAVKFSHYFTRSLLNRLYFWSVNLPKLDYSKADVYADSGDLDYELIINVLREEGLRIVKFYSYFFADSWFRLPTAPFYKVVSVPDKTLLIAKKTE
ncbi:MAG: methyltransferase domain-containing protein [Candidatus Bathyarchaeia archaeon]